ncbi:MAG: hypothetical protein RR235_07335 [Oscillospiraceae bacterium]
MSGNADDFKADLKFVAQTQGKGEIRALEISPDLALLLADASYVEYPCLVNAKWTGLKYRVIWEKR